MHSEFHSEMPGTQNSPFWAMKVRIPLAQAGFENAIGVEFGGGISVLTIKTGMQNEGSEHTACLDWEESLGRQQWERGPQEPSGSMELGAVREGAEEREQGVFHHFFPFPLHPKFLLLLCFSPLWKT